MATKKWSSIASKTGKGQTVGKSKCIPSPNPELMGDTPRGWNYRIVKVAEESLGLHEVYYNLDGTPRGSSSVDTDWKSEADIMLYMEALTQALGHPVLVKQNYGTLFKDK